MKTHIIYENGKDFSPRLELLANINPDILTFKNIDLSEGIPYQVYQCYKCYELSFINCKLSSLDSQIINLQLHSIYLSNNEFTEFPMVLLSIPTLTSCNFDDNNITFLPEIMNHSHLTISLANQTIDKQPRGTVLFKNTCFRKGNIMSILERRHNYIILGFDYEWQNRAGQKLYDIRSDIIYYSYRGDRLINTSLRSMKLLTELEPFYNKLLFAQRRSELLPEGSYLFRGLNMNLVNGISIGSIIKDYGFSSYSMDLDIAYIFSVHILVLEIPKNVSGIYLNIKYKLTHFDEKEVILGPGLNLEVTNIINYRDTTYYFVKMLPFETLEFQSESLLPKIQRIDRIMKVNDGIIIGRKFFLSVNDLHEKYKIFAELGEKMFDYLDNKYLYYYKLFLALISNDNIVIVNSNDSLKTLLSIDNFYEEFYVSIDGMPKDIQGQEAKKLLQKQQLTSWTDFQGVTHPVRYSMTNLNF